MCPSPMFGLAPTTMSHSGNFHSVFQKHFLLGALLMLHQLPWQLNKPLGKKIQMLSP